ncbi:hypothetical protein BP6252_03082 [Coleophoma cylindrospora]|uniref:Uncharacterized protein n=1 Tax=Coleophoma cylindrospora TaxID=1849047 RepID=A0A3D8S702_9HELO|nr:hypothetical protein BP6252_03082 [Coleophoma cylindrospora]
MVSYSFTEVASNSESSTREHEYKAAWGIGWWTPTLIIVSYLSAVVIAVGHLLFFKFLDGKIAEGPGLVFEQSYMTTISNILAACFEITIQTSLGIAFVQYLWHVLRKVALPVSTIETLFCLRSSPQLVFSGTGLRNAPMLTFIAIVIFATYIAKAFPTGAITVVTSRQSLITEMSVPTYNGSFVGNGSAVDATKFTFDTFITDGDFLETGYMMPQQTSQAFLKRLANSVVIGGAPMTMPSLCGSNCSYTTVFEGPYLKCNRSLSTVSSSLNSTVITTVTGLDPVIYNGTWSLPNATYTATTLSVMAGSQDRISYVAEQQVLSCASYRVDYTFKNSYENGVQNFSMSRSNLQPLTDFTTEPGVNVTGFWDLDTQDFGTAAAEWNSTSLRFYADVNHMNLIRIIGMTLAGQYSVFGLKVLGALNTTIPGYGGLWTTDAGWIDTTLGTGTTTVGPINGTLIANSQLNNGIPQKTISFNVTEEALNSMLMNLTLSAITAYNYWQTTANVTTSSTVNLYSFSKPLNLILPYFLSLLVSLPLIILGLWALHSNGVSANDGGFVQLVTTSMGSATLEREAAKACLGGTENIWESLAELRIRFGELIETGDRPGFYKSMKRAGFGTVDETRPLAKGAEYGMNETSEEPAVRFF